MCVDDGGDHQHGCSHQHKIPYHGTGAVLLMRPAHVLFGVFGFAPIYGKHAEREREISTRFYT